MSLATYHKDNACSKCGETGASTEYCNGVHVRAMPTFTDPTAVAEIGKPCQPHGEHFHRTCHNCSYEWLEAVVPASESLATFSLEHLMSLAPRWEAGMHYDARFFMVIAVYFNMSAKPYDYYLCTKTHVADVGNSPGSDAGKQYWRKIAWSFSSRQGADLMWEMVE